jgi:hypothetical protein
MAGGGAQAQDGSHAGVSRLRLLVGATFSGQQLHRDGAKGVPAQTDFLHRIDGFREAPVLADATEHEAQVVGPAGEFFWIHGHAEGLPQGEGGVVVEQVGVAARVLYRDGCEAESRPMGQPLGSAFAGSTEPMGEEDQAGRRGAVGQVELKRQAACPPAVMDVGEVDGVGCNCRRPGGCPGRVSAGTQCAVHSTRPKCQVASTTMPKAMRYQAKGTKSWLEM